MIYRAVIEDNNHPDKNGKVKVRIFGIHTNNNENSSEDFNFISSAELPWAEVMGSTSSGIISGIGHSVVLKQGMMVWVMLDQGDTNFPIVVGTVSGIPTVDPTSEYKDGNGFVDPDGALPLPDRLNEPDVNRLARAEKLDETIHKTINDNLIDYEPQSTNDLTKYPECSVIESISGHVIEIDDTIDNERLRVFHKSGSYVEFKPSGDIVVHTEGDDFQLVRGQAKIQVLELMTIDAKGNLIINGDVKIDGSQEITGKLSSALGVTSGAEISDVVGNLSSIRSTFNAHTHGYFQDVSGTGPVAAVSDPTAPEQPQRDTDFVWEE